MLIEPQAAQTFCEHYTEIMAEIHVLSKGENGIGVHMMIAKSRKIAVSNPAILDTALQNLESTDDPIHPDVIRIAPTEQLGLPSRHESLLCVYQPGGYSRIRCTGFNGSHSEDHRGHRHLYSNWHR